MKKLLIACLAILMGATVSSAQDDFDRGVFNRLGVNLSAGTEGIGIGVATPITNYLELGFDMNIMPGFKAKGDVNVNYYTGSIPVPLPSSEKVKISGDLKRTMMDVKLSVYPFGGNSTFFVAGGFSFGSEKLATLTGHSDAVQEAISTYPQYKDLIHPHRKNTISLFLLALEGLNLHTQFGWHDGIEEDTHDGGDGKA
jgi:hypothetical protein